MSKRFSLYRIWPIGLLGIFLLGLSCGDDGQNNCYTETDVFLGVALRRIDTTQTERACTLKVVVRGLDQETALYDTVSLSSLQLPLQPTLNETDYLLHMTADSVWYSDTLRICHTNQASFLSMECGGIVTHRITGLETSHHYIQEAIVLDDQVKNEATVHVKIYVP